MSKELWKKICEKMSAVESIQSDVAWIEPRPWNHEREKRVRKKRRTQNGLDCVSRRGIIGGDILSGFGLGLDWVGVASPAGFSGQSEVCLGMKKIFGVCKIRQKTRKYFPFNSSTADLCYA